MAAMRDRKGQFLKGFDGMKPVRPNRKKAIASFEKKRPEKTLNVPLADSGTVRFGGDMKLAAPGARVNVNVGSIDRGASAPRPGDKKGSRPTVIKTGGAMITKTQGDVVRGDRNANGLAGVKLSKGQQDRLAERDASMLRGREKSLKRRAAISAARKGEQRNPAESVQAANNAKVMNAAEMSPQQKIEAYQLMHGKAPSAAATAKLKAADAKGVRSPEARAARNEVTAARLAAGPEKSYSQVKAEREKAASALKPAGADQQQVVSASAFSSPTADRVKAMEAALAKEDAAVKAAEAADKKRLAAKALQPTDSHNATLKRNTSMADMVVAKNFKPAGADQKAVVSPAAPATSRSWDEVRTEQKNLEANLASVRSARLARGGKTTSAEEKKIKAQIAGLDAEKKAASARENKARMEKMGDPRDRADWIPEGSALDLKSKQRGGRANALGNALTSFLEKKDIGAKDLKPSGGDQQRVVPPAPTGPNSNLSTQQKKDLAELNNARKYLQDDKQYAQAMRGSSDQEEAEMADLQVHEAEKFVRHLEASLKAQGVDIKLADGPLSAGGAPTKAVVSPPKPPENTYKASLQRQAKEVADLMNTYPKGSASYLRHYNIYSALTEKARKIRD